MEFGVGVGMKKSKTKRKSDLLRKFHKGALRISIVDYEKITIGKRKDFYFKSRGNYLFASIVFKSIEKFGYKRANHTPSWNVQRRKHRKEEIDFNLE